MADDILLDFLHMEYVQLIDGLKGTDVSRLGVIS